MMGSLHLDEGLDLQLTMATNLVQQLFFEASGQQESQTFLNKMYFFLFCPVN